MDFLTLPAIVHQKITDYLDPFYLLNLAQTTQYCLDFVTNENFIHGYCLARFGIPITQIPDLKRWERLFANTKCLMHQKTQFLKIDESLEIYEIDNLLRIDEPLLKLYLLDYRISWFARRLMSPLDSSFLFGSDENAMFELEARKPGMRRFLIRLITTVHIDFFQMRFSDNSDDNFIFEMALRNPSQETYHQGINDESYSTCLYFSINVDLLWCTDSSTSNLSFVIFHDFSWRVIYRKTSFATDWDPQGSERIGADATVDEIRTLANPILDIFWNSLLLNHHHNPPRYLPNPYPDPKIFLSCDKKNQNPFIIFHEECTLCLSKVIESISSELDQKLASSVHICQKKIIHFLDSRFPCMNLDHDNGCQRDRKSPIVRVALIRALRRMINTIYLQDAYNIYNCDSQTSQLAETFVISNIGGKKWPWQIRRNGRGGRVIDFLGDACSHGGCPDLWPALITVKAIQQLPQLALELEHDVVEFVSGGFVADNYWYSLGYSLDEYAKVNGYCSDK